MSLWLSNKNENKFKNLKMSTYNTMYSANKKGKKELNLAKAIRITG